jgi:hypothetical protein
MECKFWDKHQQEHEHTDLIAVCPWLILQHLFLERYFHWDCQTGDNQISTQSTTWKNIKAEKHSPEFCEQWGYHLSPIFPAHFLQSANSNPDKIYNTHCKTISVKKINNINYKEN